ncbi:MAG: peptide deformylase [Flavobacteriales bacterium]|nr:peptide deformylase [Flavobacteriales bacterium]|tara:strand:+ start:6392 stop:6946 length:555 start_codon:yes stop_codon:yes gene_type:complete
MILPIYIYGSSILRSECKDINSNYKELDVIIDNMFMTMENANGIGLSAPQIGLPINLFIIDLLPYSKEDASIPPIRKTFINPKIIKEFGEDIVENEGCLSIPGVREDVTRKNIVQITYLDQDFKKNDEIIDGLYSRVFQHEFDHLKKTLFIDYLSPIKKNIVNRKLKSIMKGKFTDLYPTILKK